MIEFNKIFTGDCLDVLKTFPDQCINCSITSPPYYGLRDYGNDSQIGHEGTPEAFIDKLVSVFREVKRVLKDDGTLWVNIGDSYAGSGKGQSSIGNNDPKRNKIRGMKTNVANATDYNLKPKDLIGIPWMLAFALRKDGWYLRQDIIWSKPNPMPESVTDRCTKAHEYIFLLSKSQKYYYDHEAIKIPLKSSSISRLNQDVDSQIGPDRVPGKTNGKMKAVIGGKKHKNIEDKSQPVNSFHATRNQNGYEWENKDGKANKRSVWEVSTKPFSEAHFATYPIDLISPCVLAGCPEDGVVLDPFGGAGTTAIAALEYKRKFALIELNQEYVKIANKRIEPYLLQKKLL